MPFYKKSEHQLLVGENFVIGPGFELRAETKDEYTYPVDGWYWFDNLDQAMSALSSITEGKVTMRQARLVLLKHNLLSDVESTISTMPGTTGQEARIEWEYATHIDKTSQLVTTLANLLSLDSAAIDNLFIEAATL